MKVIFVGLPESGKTTFIGALSHLLTAARQRTSLRLAGLSENEEHTSTLEERWLRCESVDRTRLKSRDEGSFQVLIGEGGVEAELSLPDLSGEAFRQPAARGQCRPGLFAALVEADGLILFTNANRPEDDRLLFDATAQYEELEAAFEAELTAAGEDHSTEPDASIEEPDGVGGERRGAPFNPDDMPEEVLLIELLQQINRRPNVERRRRLAVVVSAWDVVTDEITPLEWGRRARPMLAEFLRHNEALWEVEFWGVSAQGGDLPQDAARLLQFSDPAERIKVIGPSSSPHDLSAPISWLLGHSVTDSK